MGYAHCCGILALLLASTSLGRLQNLIILDFPQFLNV
jgi:hypothetical protein